MFSKNKIGILLIRMLYILDQTSFNKERAVQI